MEDRLVLKSDPPTTTQRDPRKNQWIYLCPMMKHFITREARTQENRVTLRLERVKSDVNAKCFTVHLRRSYSSSLDLFRNKTQAGFGQVESHES
jgi:hypothetical protein